MGDRDYKRYMRMRNSAITFGAVLWDVINGKEYIGGAPYNLAAQLNQLGFASKLVTGIGNDKRGARILEQFSLQGMNSELIQIVDNYMTGYAEAVISEKGIPSYVIPEDTAFDQISYTDYLDNIVRNEQFDLFCYGTFDQRSARNRKTLKHIWERIDSRVNFFDVNLREPFYSREIIEDSLDHADIVKINDEELVKLSEILHGKLLDEKEFFNSLGKNFELKMIIETKGKLGCTVWEKGYVINTPIQGSESVVVVDTVGSGDAFCAGFLWSYVNGCSTGICSRNGNILGSYVVQSSGAVPPLNDELKQHFKKE